ncbi:LOW QUALITY PROTEIN: amyloid beta precursor like protein 1 [Gadus macrocephalus]|uniref:LOW QUALITY PROTEIN: amyloid beta precursor like protein 1 n=1 Tax=Gadus macrocephalus TaxID=80720 RepID=UPI0028CB2EAD|nr:LOW QUALITY PROTEIN: amyloid beta precursor like protein 1 [Gadus macrocephalus]
MGPTMMPILVAVMSVCIWSNVEALAAAELSGPGAPAMAEVNGPGRPLVAEPQIAMFCGHQLLHMNTETAQWEPDPQGRQGCFTLPSQILSYCQEMYPTLQISHVEESSSPATIPAWCKKGWGHCQTRPFIVMPFRCLVGEYVSEALLVPDRCRFLHQEQMDTCETYVFWHNIARRACTADPALELHSYGMLLPCGERYRGVEYVCCPGRGATRRAASSKGDAEGGEGPPTGSQTLTLPAPGKTSSVAVKVTSAPPSPSTDVDDLEEEGDAVEEEEEEEEEEEVEEEEEEGEEEVGEKPPVKEPEEYDYPIDSGPYQASDYLDSFYYEKGQGRKPTASPPRTRGDSLPTARPTDGVDVYFEMPGDDSEHANFLRAKMDLEERRMKRINEIMKEWAEADNQSKNLPKSERQSLNEHFQTVLQTLEEQIAGQRQKLVETHLARVVATLNNNRRMALESYLTAVQTAPPQPERVLQALKRYMAAEQKDRRHTLRHYQHIEAVDPQKAEQMKFQVYTHLHVIEERMNQSLALLYKVPLLADELHHDIQELVKAERGDISELMTTSFSETRTTEELLPAESEEEKDDEEEEERAFQNRPYPPRIEPQPNKKVSAIEDYDYTTSERAPTYEYEEKINTSVELKQVVYKSPEIQRDELQPDALETFNRGAMVGLLVVAVAIAMVMVISLLLVRRKPYGTISHGIVEVDPMLTPEERQLNKMQNHGYENPTYKFFEQMS